MIDERSEQRLSGLYPPFAERVRSVINALAGAGLEFRVVQGLRTFVEQDALFAQGRSRPGAVVTRARGGYSHHNYGTAADLCCFTDGKPDWNNNSAFMKLGIEAENAGLQWGGDWGKFVDKPHVELVLLSLPECLAIYKKGQLPAVWVAFDAKLGVTVEPEPEPEPTPESESEESAVEAAPEPEPARSPSVARRKKVLVKKGKK